MELTQQTLKELLEYDRETGLFRRRKAIARRSRVGELAGGVVFHGHIAIRVMGKRYLAHRLAWLYVYGYLPLEVDHINGKADDNRISNLRECTHAQNGKNRRKYKNNTSGRKGVTLLPNGKWRAVICCDGKFVHLGCFLTLEDAHSAYVDAAKRLHGEYASFG